MMVCTTEDILTEGGRRQSRRITMTENAPTSVKDAEGVNQEWGSERRDRLPKHKDNTV